MCGFACGPEFLRLAVLENVLEEALAVAGDPEVRRTHGGSLWIPCGHVKRRLRLSRPKRVHVAQRRQGRSACARDDCSLGREKQLRWKGSCFQASARRHLKPPRLTLCFTPAAYPHLFPIVSVPSVRPQADPRVQEKIVDVLRVLVVQEPCSGYRDALDELISTAPDQARARGSWIDFKPCGSALV